MIGPCVYHHDPPNMIQSAGGHLTAAWQSVHLRANEVDDGRTQAPYPVDWISGCALLVRREVIEQVGMLDERFFYYWEETDWCRRTRRAGWQLLLAPSAKLWHKGVKPTYRPSPSVTYYNTRSRFLFMAKDAAPFPAWYAAWAEVARTAITWTVRPKWRHMRQHRNALMQGAWDFLRQRWGMRPT
jgi:GT2 family glycosyltransferase